MSIRQSHKGLGNVPNWAWLVALVPWFWTIPLNQYFWDDWAISANPGLEAQMRFWMFQAKHPMNPYVYSALLPLGPWAFHVVVIVSTLVLARALPSILSATKFVDARLAAWAGPIAVAAPVFHARVSIATLEYSICIATVLVGWALLLKPQNRLRELTANALLVFSVGVPSLAILFPVIWITTVLRRLESRGVRDSLRKFLRYSYLLLIPVVYSFVFRIALNTKNKFKVSSDGLTDFNNDLVRLVVLSVVALLVIRIWRRNWFGYSWRLAVGAIAAYVALFPYFAVGYKPLYDFMPWKMRSYVKDVAPMRLAYVFVLLLVVALAVYFIGARKLSRRHTGLSLPVIIGAVVFGSATAVLGPMDWESRHWLIAWPALVALFVVAISGVVQEAERAVARAVLVVFAVSATLISSEYVADSLKQRSIVQAIRQESERLQFGGTTDGDLAVLVYFFNSPDKLNARFRKLRPYEWWGLVAKGLDVDPQKVKLLEPGDFDLLVRHLTCEFPIPVLQIEPEVNSSHRSALTRLQVDVELYARIIQLCNIRVRYGWPRDPVVQPS